MKTLLYIGAFDAAEIIAIRPSFDICYIVDTDTAKSEYIAGLFKNDPKVRVIHTAPSEPSGHQFCEDNDIDRIDTLLISPGGSDKVFLTAFGLACLKDRPSSVVGVKAAGLDEITEELRAFLAREYGPPIESSQFAGYGGRGAVRAQWWSKPDSTFTTVRSGGAKADRDEKQRSFNCVYAYLRDENWTISRRGNVEVLLSSTPQPGYDLYLYHDAFSYRGKQAGYDVVLISEPLVILPGQYNRDIWDLFDHGFAFYDAPIEIDPKFSKVISWIGDWSAETAITEDLEKRERLYPIRGRQKSICMINGNKTTWVQEGALYPKRIEAALWFSTNSDIPFDVFGRPPFLLSNYRGIVADNMRLRLLAQYRYNWCFENTDHPVFGLGYVAEKILDCLETRTVPIYLGNPNIEKYVPKECFIDFRDFGSCAAVNDYLHGITEEEYMTYVENIDRWVSGGGLRPYSWQTFYNQLARWYSEQTGIDFQSLVGDETKWERERAIARSTAAPPTLWTFDDLRFRPSQFMLQTEIEDAAKVHPLKKVIADSEGRIRRAADLASNGAYAEAVKEIAFAGFNGTAEPLYICGQIMHLAGFEEAALVQLTMALSMDPNHSYAHNLLGVLRFQKGEVMKAEEEFRKATELDSGNHLARKNLAFLLLNTGRKREAMPLARSVEPYFPEEVRGWGV